MLTKSKKYIIHRGMLSLIFAFTLSVSAILSPLVRAEESPKYKWNKLEVSGSGYAAYSIISPDGSKLFVLPQDSRKLLVSTDNGATWSSFDIPFSNIELQVNTDGSKILASEIRGGSGFYMSTDGGRTWTEHDMSVYGLYMMSPDGSTIAKCGYGSESQFFISKDDGRTWTQKGNGCPSRIFNDGKMVMQINDLDDWDLVKYLKWSTDYGETWSSVDINGNGYQLSFSDDGNYVFESTQFLISSDGGRSWSSLPSPLDSQQGFRMYEYTQAGISNDGKRLFIAPLQGHGEIMPSWSIYTSVDGGNTWQLWGDGDKSFSGNVSMSSDGSKILAVDDPSVRRLRARSYYRLATLPTPQPATPGDTGTGTGGATAPSTTTTPSTGSSSSGTSAAATPSSTSSKKPEKSSSNLAETGISVWAVGGLAVVAVAVGGLALRKRL